MRRSAAPSQLMMAKKPRVTYFEKGSDDEDDGAPEDEQKKSLAHFMNSGNVSAYEQAIRSILSKPFKIPMAGYEGRTSAKLGMTRDQVRGALHSPDEENALILYVPPEEYLNLPPPTFTPSKEKKEIFVHVVVDPVLTKVLRPHQREGVKFMWDCATGVKLENGNGCIMADDMGLGKTLQCITLLWTLLKQGKNAKPTIENALIVCPSSLVRNWFNEMSKWLGNKVNPIAIDGGGKDEIEPKLRNFINPDLRLKKSIAYHPVCVISYETFRIYSEILCSKPVGLVLCDEGHRLKNSDSQTFVALNKLQTTRRVILSGTPVQNDLTEYFSLLNFVNPGLLGNSNEFRRKYEIPIMKARDSLATDKEMADGKERLQELLNLANKFTIRRTNAILAHYLPVKIEQVVFCKMSDVQKALYKNFLESKSALKASNGGGSLMGITTLKKLANHPALIWDKIEKRDDGFQNAMDYLPRDFNPKSYRANESFRPEFSGKFMVLDTFLANLRATTNDKIVLVSNYTQTLDMFEQLCRARRYGFVRLDGSLSINQRGKLVTRFNDPGSGDFAFLLSSKAGGCGLNLIGANRLILFDPDWNPANDEQAMARVWRDGQRKKCFIYRFVTTGTIEEKIFQRQAHKQALSSCVVDEEQDVERHFSGEFLRDLFKFKEDTPSDTHDTYKCKKCEEYKAKMGKVRREPSIGNNDDMASWDHYPDPTKLPDEILRKSLVGIVSFVFANQSHEKQLGGEETKPAPPPSAEELAEARRKANEDDEDYEDGEDGDDDEWGGGKKRKGAPSSSSAGSRFGRGGAGRATRSRSG